MFYIADLYDVLNFLFNAAIWILILFCVIKILDFLKRLIVKSTNVLMWATFTGTRNGMMGLFIFLKAKDIPLRVKVIYLMIGGTLLFAVIKGFTTNNL